MRGSRLIAWFAMVTAMAACVDTSSLVGTPHATTDGGSDASVAEASPDDASASDGAASDAGASLCALPGALACDDFDLGQLGAQWSGMESSANVTIELDTTAARSAPRSLLVTAAQSTQGARYGRLRKSVPLGSAPRGVTCQLRFNLESTGAAATEDVNILRLTLGFAAGVRTLDLQVTPTNAFIDERGAGADGGSRYGSSSDVAYGKGAWVKWSLSTDYRTATLTRDDGVPTKLTLDALTPTSMEISVGLCQDADTAAWKYRIDDVRCDAQ